MTTPSVSDLQVFLETFETLDKFEAMCRDSRGYGAFPKDAKLPFPEVVRVFAWLRSLVREGGIDTEKSTLRDSVRFKNMALREAALQFLYYADNHNAKNPPDIEKAKTNAEWAARCSNAADYPKAARLGDKVVDNGGNS